MKANNSVTTFLIVLFFLTGCGSSNPAADSENISIEDLTLTDNESVDRLPEPDGTMANMLRGLRYPEEARRAGVEGQVIVEFIVHTSGRVLNPVVVSGIGYGCDEEALRVIRAATYKPAMKNGEQVNVRHTAAIRFRITSVSGV